jgi:hypothetical protein
MPPTRIYKSRPPEIDFWGLQLKKFSNLINLAVLNLHRVIDKGGTFWDFPPGKCIAL